MKLISRTAAAALIISLPMALGACGSDGGSKPSKADVKAGFTKAMKSSSEGKAVPSATLDKLSTCTVDKIYDKVSNKTLNTIKDGDTEKKISSDDESKLSDATKSCATSAVG